MEILYEDNHIIAVNKLAGEIVQGDKTGDETLIDKVKRYLKDKHQKPGNVFLGVVHRIDRPARGLVMLAKTGKALARLNEMLRQNQIKKTYWAVVTSRPPAESGELRHYLVRDTEKNKAFAHDKKVADSQLAVLSYKIIAQKKDFYLLEIDLITGRHHQIRAQLSQIGCPIVGDVKYGYALPNPDAGICLHSRQMEFVHPVSKQPVKITAPLPPKSSWPDFISCYNQNIDK